MPLIVNLLATPVEALEWLRMVLTVIVALSAGPCG